MKLHLNNKAIKALVSSYARAFLGAAIAAYSAGLRDWKALGLAGLVAIIAPAIRAINPKDPMFGLVADEAQKAVQAEEDKVIKLAKK